MAQVSLDGGPDFARWSMARGLCTLAGTLTAAALTGGGVTGGALTAHWLVLSLLLPSLVGALTAAVLTRWR